jgi:hypothetical protein
MVSFGIFGSFVIASILSAIIAALLDVDDDDSSNSTCDTERDSDCEDEDDEEDDEDDEERSWRDDFVDICKYFSYVSKKCPNLKKYINELLAHFCELESLDDAINELEQTAHKLTYIPEAKDAFQKIIKALYQNARDIKAVLVSSRVLEKKALTEKELVTVKSELASNRRMLNKFQALLSEVAEKSIQKDDAFSDMDIDSSLTAIRNASSNQNGGDNDISDIFEFGKTIKSPDNDKKAL